MATGRMAPCVRAGRMDDAAARASAWAERQRCRNFSAGCSQPDAGKCGCSRLAQRDEAGVGALGNTGSHAQEHGALDVQKAGEP